MSKRIDREIYNKAKEEGKVSENPDWLKLFVQIKDEGGKPAGTRSTGPHKVVFLGPNKKLTGKNPRTGEEREEIEYFFEEDGEKKRYRAPVWNADETELHYLVQRFKDYKEGDSLILEGKKSGKTSFVDVTPHEVNKNSVNTPQGNVTDDDIPVVDADEGTGPPPAKDDPEDAPDPNVQPSKKERREMGQIEEEDFKKSNPSLDDPEVRENHAR